MDATVRAVSRAEPSPSDAQPSLPIDAIRADFDGALELCGRLVVTAETGAGKSTRVPVWLAERFDGLILVVEPRRVACTALADFLAAERGDGSAGGYFGSRVRFDDRSSAETRVLFCTPGVALRMLANGRSKAMQLGAIVVDEFHERSWQMDLVVAAATSLPNLCALPLVLTSATIDAEEAAMAIDARTLHARGRTFPVEIRYDGSSLEPSTHELGPRVAAAVENALASQEGDALVFLPGIREIRSVETALGRRSEELLIVHGSQPPELMRRVFRRGSKRRIYLATNIAETSITLPGVRIVIDSGLAKSRLHRAGRAVLATVPISEASMEQRAGRAGRVAAGCCLRLWSDRFRPEPFQRPEIERVELDDLLLQAAEIGIGRDALAEVRWVTPPPDFAVQRAIERLSALDAVDRAGITERGRQLAQLPVSADEAALLVGAPPEIDGTVCDLVALLQSRGGLMRNVGELSTDERTAVQDARASLLAGLTDEVNTQLELLRKGEVRRHYLSGRRLGEVRAIAAQLRALVGVRGGTAERSSARGLAAYILSRLPAAGFVLRPRASKARGRSRPWGNGSIELQVEPYEPQDPETEAQQPDAGVILETDWLSSARGVVGIGRMLLPATRAELAAAGLGTATLTGVTMERSRRGRITVAAQREVQLAGVTLVRDEAPLSGAELCDAVAELVFDNRLFKGARDAIRDALHGWFVIARWTGDPLTEPPRGADTIPEDEAAWLAARLATLGLEESGDLELIDTADLLPDIAVETGVEAWIHEPIVKALPRSWTYQGGTYSCTVQHLARTVLLAPLDAKAKKLKEPPASALPRFYGFRVDYLQGSRRLRLR